MARTHKAARAARVGLGQTGTPLAIYLAGSFDAIAHDQRPDEAAAKHTGHPSAPVECPHVFPSLPPGKVPEIALFDAENGLAGILGFGAVIVDASPEESNATVDIGDRLDEMGLHFLAASVSAMPKRAGNGTLTMMACKDAARAREREPAKRTMADTILCMGPRGVGQLIKRIGQLLFDNNMATLAEILPVSVRLGLNTKQVADAIDAGTGRSPFLGVADSGAAPASYQRALAEGLGEPDKGARVKLCETLLAAAFREHDEGDK